MLCQKTFRGVSAKRTFSKIVVYPVGHFFRCVVLFPKIHYKAKSVGCRAKLGEAVWWIGGGLGSTGFSVWGNGYDIPIKFCRCCKGYSDLVNGSVLADLAVGRFRRILVGLLLAKFLTTVIAVGLGRLVCFHPHSFWGPAWELRLPLGFEFAEGTPTQHLLLWGW